MSCASSRRRKLEEQGIKEFALLERFNLTREERRKAQVYIKQRESYVTRERKEARLKPSIVNTKKISSRYLLGDS